MKWLGRVLSFIVGPIIYVLTPHGKARVRVVVRYKNDILLVKSWLSSQKWDLPGGGIDRGERPTMAAVREVYEETSLFINKNQLSYIGTVEAPWPLKCSLVVYEVWVESKNLDSLPWFRQVEICDREWFSIKNLPTNRDSIVKLAIDKKLDILQKS